MSIQSDAAAIGWQSVQDVSGVSVTVERPGGGGPTAATVVAGDTIVEAMDEQGQSVKLKVRDYLIERTVFEAIVGAGEKPDRGDLFVETVADYSRTYAAIELAGEVSRWWDKNGLVLRIHTVETGQVTTTTAGA
jgi:hypothetical protein